jgi:glycerol uptake facilitator-like aquaporin
MIIAAIPAGGFGGFLCGYYLCLGILMILGMGNSHNDMFTVVAAGMLGVAVGALLLPLTGQTRQGVPSRGRRAE